MKQVTDLQKRIQDALGTAEEGENLVGVARDAHTAEQRLAHIIRILEDENIVDDERVMRALNVVGRGTE